jgi:hypothetical protein
MQKVSAFYITTCVIPGFRRVVNENGALLGYYATNSGNFLPARQDNPSVQSKIMPVAPVQAQCVINRLSRNVGKKLPLLAAY